MFCLLVVLVRLSVLLLVIDWQVSSLFFFFQAEDGIRDWSVTGVQTCALPISGAGFPATTNRVDAGEPGPFRSAPSVLRAAAPALRAFGRADGGCGAGALDRLCQCSKPA